MNRNYCKTAGRNLKIIIKEPRKNDASGLQPYKLQSGRESGGSHANHLSTVCCCAPLCVELNPCRLHVVLLR